MRPRFLPCILRMAAALGLILGAGSAAAASDCTRAADPTCLRAFEIPGAGGRFS